MNTSVNSLENLYVTELGILDDHCYNILCECGDIEIYRTYTVDLDSVPDDVNMFAELEAHCDGVIPLPHWVVS